ncbi:TolC family protein [Cesiribacter andamanensis]|uniref:Outer membrane channel protein n=1 Tax=Cesiribacter andamanensis AMV16 TaxID=1279009 RepID=M7NQF9_9BACT|nr:TolC family protein [Cesiribacter andamanensis]EMR03960.1 outer membrane channel protein [Cesiribacter andamanensis AMV16]
MKCSLIFLYFFGLLPLSLFAQEGTGSLSLEQALQTALTNNLQVRQRQLSLQGSQVDYRQAKSNLLPTINASISHGINQGRSIDPFTNTYVNQELKYGSYGVGGSLLLFGGLSQQNAIRQTSLARDAAGQELQQARDNLSLEVMLAYLQVLSNEDLVEVAGNQVAVTQQQVDRLQVLLKQGAIGPPQLAEMSGQLKTEELALLNARQTLEVSKLALAQLMNVPYTPSLQLERIEVSELVMRESAATTADAVYEASMGQLALVKAARLRSRSAQAGVRSLWGNFSPSLFLFGNLNTNYSSAATINGEQIYYDAQLRNNLFSNVGLLLRIPILNGFDSHNQLRRAKLELQDVNLQEEGVLVQLRQDVEQAQLNRDNARERYQLLEEQQSAFAEAFRAAEIRFNAGAGTPVDYLIAKNNADRSRINLLMAKYDYVLRQKVLDFYRGK